MEERVIDCRKIAKVCLHFEPIDPYSPEALLKGASAEDLIADLNHNYDYEEEGTDRFLFYIDAGMDLYPVAKILTRTTFEIIYEGKLEELFIPELMQTMDKAAFKVCMEGMKQYCADNGIKLPSEIHLPEDTINNFAQHAIDMYMNSRRKDDAANARMIEKKFLNFSPGNDITLLIEATFMVTDEVFFLNPAFDHKPCVEAFAVPAPVYHTVKLKSLRGVNEDIVLNLYHSTFFLICVDFALQMLVGDHADVLEPALEAKGLNKELRKAYIEFAGNFLNEIKSGLKRNGAHVSNLEKVYDWNSLIKRK